MITLSTLLYGLLGLLIGVLVNRAADDLPPPARRSIFAAPRCAYCGTPRQLTEQIGMVSFLLWRGRCHNCYAPLPLRAPVVEISCAVLFAFLWQRVGFGITLVGYSLFTALLLLILVIDLEHRLILDVVSLPATTAALLLSPITLADKLPPNTAPERVVLISILGAATGYIVVLGIYFFGGFVANLLARARGRELNEIAFGFGDVKLAGLVGALVGFPGIFFALIYTIVLGGIGALAVIIFQLIVYRRYSAFMAIPYGPYFVIAAWIFMVWGRELLARFFGGG